MTNLIKRFVQDDSGATAIEYGLIAAGISVAQVSAASRPYREAPAGLSELFRFSEDSGQTRAKSKQFYGLAIPALQIFSV